MRFGIHVNLHVTLRQGGVSSVAPKAFRAALVRFAPQFKGYSQQDSQEVRPCSAGTPTLQCWDPLICTARPEPKVLCISSTSTVLCTVIKPQVDKRSEAPRCP